METEDCATYFFKEVRWATGQAPRRLLPSSLSFSLQGESDVGGHDRVIVLTAHKLNIKADVEMRGRAQTAKEEAGYLQGASLMRVGIYQLGFTSH